MPTVNRAPEAIQRWAAARARHELTQARAAGGDLAAVHEGIAAVMHQTAEQHAEAAVLMASFRGLRGRRLANAMEGLRCGSRIVAALVAYESAGPVSADWQDEAEGVAQHG